MNTSALPAVMHLLSLVDDGECSAMCLFALVPDGDCSCHCGGHWHGYARGLTPGVGYPEEQSHCGYCGKTIQRLRPLSTEMSSAFTAAELQHMDVPAPLPTECWRHVRRGMGHRATPCDWGYAEQPVHPWDKRH